MEKKKLFRYADFVNENQTKEKEETTTTPTTIPRPQRQGSPTIPDERPSVAPDPLAYGKDGVYANGTKEKEETTTTPTTIPRPQRQGSPTVPTERPSVAPDPLAELKELYPGEVYAASEDGTIFVGDVNTKTKDPAKALEYMKKQSDPEAQAHMGDNKLEESRRTNRRRK
jgi:hypothetical protein